MPAFAGVTADAWLTEIRISAQRTLCIDVSYLVHVVPMAKKNPHVGSSFESWLDEAGIREEVTAAAAKAVIARQLAREMKKKKITKQRMAQLMQTSRAQVDRLLDPDNGSATIESLQGAGRASSDGS